MTNTAPERLTFEAAVTLTAGKTPRFTMTAYSGGLMRPRGFSSDLVVDLAGMQKKREPLPILLDHATDQIVGHTDKIAISRQSVTAAGIISGGGEAAQEVLQASRNGFPWRASIGASIERTEFVDADKSVTVNDQVFSGPIVVVRASTLAEISFVASAADDASEVSIAARGDSEMSTETKTPASDPLQAVRDREAAETERIHGIRRICAAGHHDIEARAIRENWDLPKTELECLRAERDQAPAIHGGRKLEATDKDVLSAGLLLHCGLDKVAAKYIGDEACNRAEPFRHYRFVDFCRAAMEAEGKYVTGLSARDLVAGGFSTGTLSTALNNSMNKSLISAYEETPSAWRSVCRIRSANDFKTHTGVRLGALEKLIPLGEAGEIKHSTYSEGTFTFEVTTYARMIAVTRNELVNDDLSILDDLPQALGRAAARAVNDEFATVLLANAGSFFSAGNNNLLTGGTSALSSTSLANAVELLRMQTDADGNLIDLRPSVLLVSPNLEVTARELLESTELSRDSTGDRLPVGNALRGVAALAVEPRLQSSTFTGSSDTQWYLWSDPSNNAMTAAFLNGRQTPVIESADTEFDTLGMQWRSYMDFGFFLSDSVAVVKSDGA